MAGTKDESFMKMALELAEVGKGSVEPNPYVGCVIVKKGEIIGIGGHKKFGGDHAEIGALRFLIASPRGATMYVNLEPCCHSTKKTPPCVPAIINSGVKNVVIAIKDPNPEVNGKGIRRLKKAGIKVRVGVCEEEAKELNKAYIKAVTTGFPYITAKWAMSLDGKIATKTGESKYISNLKTRTYTKSLRKEFQAIVIGSRTAIVDNPTLIACDDVLLNPVRVVFDSDLKISENSNLVRTIDKAHLIIATTSSNKRKINCLKKKGAEIWQFEKDKNDRVPMRQVMKKLSERGFINVLIEGGGELIAEALHFKLVDSIIAIVSPKLIGGKEAPTPVAGRGIRKISDAISLKIKDFRKFDEDFLIFADMMKERL